ncbi:hypothetical protein FB565_001736 [Actinoplanes lutulentus]|uniref:Uncharacterized protein n=1 Tax=Actinoplanes lutulentus TaxID=1287878 RepID=A0A327ZGL8_9ACTN|nr:hypothetical protein [Actinoplanes lutulentus]RAK39944.1 hypothetical protein B0I29_104486 [Actinoplanes lutulentus]
MTRTVRSRRAEIANQPLYARTLRLRHLAPSGLLCFVFLEGTLVLGILLALAELVSWWGVLVLPITVALMVKFNDLIAGALTHQHVVADPTTVRASVLRSAAMPDSHDDDSAFSQAQTMITGAAPAVEHRMTGLGFGFASSGSEQTGALFGFPGSDQNPRQFSPADHEQPASIFSGYGQAAQPGYGSAGADQPAGYGLAGADQPGYGLVGAEQPGFEIAGADQRGYGFAGSGQPGHAQGNGAVFGLSGAGQAPGGFGQAQGSYGQAPGSYGQAPGSFEQTPGGLGQAPGGFGQVPSGFGYAGANAGDGYGDPGYPGGQNGYGPAANYAHADGQPRPGVPAVGAPARRQWADQLDVRQQMARQAAARRYE